VKGVDHSDGAARTANRTNAPRGRGTQTQMPAIGRLGSVFAFAAPSVGSSSPKTCPWQGHARSSIATSHTRIRSSRQLHGSSADDLQLAMVACLGPSFCASTTARRESPPFAERRGSGHGHSVLWALLVPESGG
jgi:hypothetical protein